MSHVKHCGRSCNSFDGWLKDKEWRKAHPGCIGFCSRYRKVVQDCLCGCEEKKDGSVTLWNFSTPEEEKSLAKRLTQKQEGKIWT